MDWYEIEYLYPNSYKRFVETMYPNMGIISISVLKNFNIKNLYNFFDKQGIYLILELNSINTWSFIIKKDNWILNHGYETKYNREEIENIGFYYCFKQLEEIINCKMNV